MFKRYIRHLFFFKRNMTMTEETVDPDVFLQTIYDQIQQPSWEASGNCITGRVKNKFVKMVSLSTEHRVAEVAINKIISSNVSSNPTFARYFLEAEVVQVFVNLEDKKIISQYHTGDHWNWIRKYIECHKKGVVGGGTSSHSLL